MSWNAAEVAMQSVMRHAASRYITLHHVTSCYITLHHATSRYVTLRDSDEPETKRVGTPGCDMWIGGVAVACIGRDVIAGSTSL